MAPLGSRPPGVNILRNSMSADLNLSDLVDHDKHFNIYAHFTDILQKNNAILMTATGF